MKQQTTTEDIRFSFANYEVLFKKLKSDHTNLKLEIMLEEYKKISNWVEADEFFHRYSVGNRTDIAENPFERSLAYELLLHILQQYDDKKFKEIHKGTPYYFIGWTSYQFGNYEKALFYLDAAVSEDIKVYELKGRKETPALKFFLLRENAVEATAYMTLHIYLNSCVGASILQFNSDSGLNLFPHELVGRFISPILFGNKKSRAILTALYSFILEEAFYRGRINLRSSEGGSLEPFINHLFKGARILESLLKLKNKGSTLDSLLKNLKNELELDNCNFKGNKTLASASLIFRSSKKSGKKFQEYNFKAAYIIRNTTGHSLIWPDESFDEKEYVLLHSALINTIFWSIYKLWIQ